MYKVHTIWYNTIMNTDQKIRMVRRAEHKKKRLSALPSFLHCQRRTWVKLIASGIIQGLLKPCCRTGCVACNFIGWKRGVPGTIVDINPPVYTTGEYGKLKNLSAKTISRMCDAGQLKHFRLPHSSHRFIIGIEE